jgi:hypothetical protein
LATAAETAAVTAAECRDDGRDGGRDGGKDGDDGRRGGRNESRRLQCPPRHGERVVADRRRRPLRIQLRDRYET